MRLVPFLSLAATAGLLAQSTNEPSHNRLLFMPGAKDPVVVPAKSATTPDSAATEDKKEKPAEIIEVFFLSLKANQIDAAYDALVANTIIANRKDDVNALKEKTRQAFDNYGPISGFEVIDDQTVGTALFRRTCISFNSDLPLRWRFYFYKSGGTWRLVDLRVDDGLVQLFDDSSKNRK